MLLCRAHVYNCGRDEAARQQGLGIWEDAGAAECAGIAGHRHRQPAPSSAGHEHTWCVRRLAWHSAALATRFPLVCGQHVGLALSCWHKQSPLLRIAVSGMLGFIPTKLDTAVPVAYE